MSKTVCLYYVRETIFKEVTGRMYLFSGGMSEAARVIWTVGSPLVLALGVVGNTMTLITLLHRRAKKTPTTIFLTLLAFADILLITVSTPRWTLIYNFGIDIRYLGNGFCKGQFFLAFMAPCVSVYSLVAMTIERLLYTLRPFDAKFLITRKVAVIVCVVVVAFSVSITSHLAYGFSLKEFEVPNQKDLPANTTANNCSDMMPIHDNISHVNIQSMNAMAVSSDVRPVVKKIKVCWMFNEKYLNFYTKTFLPISFVYYLVIPIIIFVVCGTIIVVKVAQSKRKASTKSDQKDDKNKQSSNQVTFTVLIINITFIVLASPAQVFMQGLSRWVDPVTGMTPLQEVVWAITNQMFFLNHAVNFLLYFMTGRKFRAQFVSIFTCLTSARGGLNDKVAADTKKINSISTF